MPKHPSSASSSLSYASLPLAFEQNRGQSPAAVKFQAPGTGFGVFFTKGEAVMSLERSTASLHRSSSASGFGGRDAQHRDFQRDVLHLRWVGANPAPRIEGLARQACRSNYLIGNNPAKWVKDVPSYSRVEYHGIYSGIDLIYYGNQRELEFDIDVAPGANLGGVRLEIAGRKHRAAKKHVNSDG